MMDFVLGTVTNVIDGDTFDIRVGRVGTNNKFAYKSNERIRINNLDAPELPSSSGYRAKNELEKAILGKYVRCNILSRDTYGRLIADITVVQRSTVA